ncbi:MAG: futalosine hydrolase [Desulfobacter sp.]|nr:futalosine hydrolase [Desulfobacter sp.]WDP85124.1 MAG: futalosine hydrolase [Desulfobacter sp.]
MSLLILSATSFEVAGLLKRAPKSSGHILKSGQVLYSGLGKEPGWHCLVTGPGGFNTAMGLGAFLDHHRPDLILDTGIAGAYAPSGLGVGDIALASQEQYFHTGVGIDFLSRIPLPFDLIQGNSKTRKGIYSFDRALVSQWLRRLKGALGQDRFKIIQGPFLTVSSITRGQDMALAIFQRFSPVMEAMEGAAAAHTAACYGVPMIEIRAASNRAGERDKGAWDIDLACDRLDKVCCIALDP